MPKPSGGGSTGTELPVWSCNWQAVEVFERCRLDLVGGLAVVYNGIAPAEIRATLELLQIPAAAWPELLDDVIYMGRRASESLNQRKPGTKGR